MYAKKWLRVGLKSTHHTLLPNKHLPSHTPAIMRQIGVFMEKHETGDANGYITCTYISVPWSTNHKMYP